jgi:hypothetical protein
MQGQSIFMSMPKTLCNRDGPCTVLAGKVGVMYADGKEALPANGMITHFIRYQAFAPTLRLMNSQVSTSTTS